MKNTSCAAFLVSLAPLSLSAATLTIDTVKPTTDIVSQNDNSGSFTTAFVDGGASFSRRGQTFNVDANTGPSYQITTLTVQTFEDQTFGGGDESMALEIFAWNPSGNGNTLTSWNMGDGAGDGDTLDGTGMTTMFSGTFDLSAHTANDYYHINFIPGEVTFQEDTAYAFVFTYLDSDFASTTPADSPNFIRFNVSGGNAYTDGLLLNTSDTTNGSVAAQDFTFYVQGVAVPEPSSLALLGLSSLALLRRRR
ncbi:hypothetical protein NT6N_20470 [Oceaniferula spumae]|uniref:Ice-binding protein C-terminal domain-containing protein n=1 Tax=Oceaniferula spumae TaxID=2979115 RepID=A0AAT9FM65_9BACT